MSIVPIATYFSVQQICWSNSDCFPRMRCNGCSSAALFERTTPESNRYYCGTCARINKSIDSLREDDLRFEQDIKGE